MDALTSPTGISACSIPTSTGSGVARTSWKAGYLQPPVGAGVGTRPTNSASR
jgi:hypothetical protein